MICANGCLRGPTGLTSDEADAPPPPPLTLMLPPPEAESYNLSFWLVVNPGMMKITINFMSKDYLFENVICDHTH